MDIGTAIVTVVAMFCVTVIILTLIVAWSNHKSTKKSE